MKTLKTLKKKILTPMILLIVLVPFATLIFFNVAMRIYMQKTARNDLKEAMLPVETLAQQELSDSASPIDEAQLEAIAVKLTQAVRSSKLSGARLLIYDKNNKLIFPHNLPDGFFSANLAGKIAARLKVTDLNGKVGQIGVGNARYLITGYNLADKSGSSVSLVLISEEGNDWPLIRMINVILLIIMLAGIGIGIFIASRLTEEMSRHMGQICDVTEAIGGGDFRQPEWKKTDIVEFDKLTRSIVCMSDKLEASEHAQRDFLQNASHELRTPLMSIQGYAEGISRGIVPDVKEAADIINSESRRLNALVEELLTLSRIESGTMKREAVHINLSGLLPEFAQRLGGIAVKQRKKINLTLPDQPVVINGDEELLGQAVTNVASNCLRYAQETVEISLLSKENSAVVRIQDDGPGIPENDLPHIFERFYKGKNGNFGLGLAIAKSAVQYMGGEIRACNLESGAAFELIFIPEKNG